MRECASHMMLESEMPTSLGCVDLDVPHLLLKKLPASPVKGAMTAGRPTGSLDLRNRRTVEWRREVPDFIEACAGRHRL